MTQLEYTLALTGSGGAGVVVTGEMLLQAAGRDGYFGLMRRSFGPQIRGGESASMLTIGLDTVERITHRVDLLVAFDWNNFNRFEDEIGLDNTSIILCDEIAGAPPASFAEQNLNVQQLPLSEAANKTEGARINMVALGFIGAWLGVSKASLLASANQRFQKKGAQILSQTNTKIELGYDLGENYLNEN